MHLLKSNAEAPASERRLASEDLRIAEQDLTRAASALMAASSRLSALKDGVGNELAQEAIVAATNQIFACLNCIAVAKSEVNRG